MYLEETIKKIKDKTDIHTEVIKSHSCSLDTIKNQLKCVQATLKSLANVPPYSHPLENTPGLDAPNCGMKWSEAEEDVIAKNYKVFIAACARYLGRSDYAIECKYKQLWKEGKIRQ